MKYFHRTALYFFLLFCLTIISASAQQSEQERVAMEREKKQQETFQRRIEQGSDQPPPRNVPTWAYPVRKSTDTTPYLPLQLAVTIPFTAEDKAKLTPADEVFEQYKEILKKPDTGLAKIFPDPHCSSEFVIDLRNSECAGALLIPGRGAFFSFRVEKNFPFPYADIHFDGGSFKVGGKTELGIISRLGDVKIETVELSSPGISAIRNFKPAKTETEIRKQEERINKGFSADGFAYSSKAAAESNQTYVARTIAFRHYEQYFNDKRVDALVVFRVVSRDADGALTIVWRKLKKSDSPRVTR